MIDRNLERLLSQTSRDTSYPATPDLASRVVLNVQAPAPLPEGARRPAAALILAAAALLVVAVLSVAPGREAVARLFGVEGSEITVVTPVPGVTPTPLPAARPLEAVLKPVPLTELQEQVDFEAAVPALDETPDAYYVIYGDQRVAVLSYDEFDLWQTELLQGASFGKLSDRMPVETEVGPYPAVWFSGGPHLVWYAELPGRTFLSSERTVERNTLIWRTETLFYRIETDLPLNDVVRIVERLP